MRVSPRTAIWPQLVAISLIGLGVAGCADSTRFGDLFGSTNSIPSRSDASGPGAQSASASHIEATPLPHLANADDGASAYGRSAGGYQPDANGAARTAAPPSYRSPAVAAAPARTTSVQPAASTRRSALVAPAVVHVVRAGQTLHSIASIYHKPVTVIARANDLAVDAKLKAGDRITIPDIKEASQATQGRVEASASPPTGNVAMADSAQTARVVEPAPAMSSQDAVKSAEPAGSLPGFRWPVRGRVIAAFGPKPNGVQNDGINLAVPEGTPIKAAEDGVVAYAGSELKGYGNLVLVRHPNGFVTAYAHASDILVKRGETVKRGQVIAHAGQTGSVTSPQLHFEIRKGATPVDPSQYLSGA
ncbi:MAG: peptidoglycan DD-metalloendopeptidase family protein [Xanthobacteraceae bacterium]|jgi:murein DD-endopeptidase MepM/ murein hydrolase activator NlpD